MLCCTGNGGGGGGDGCCPRSVPDPELRVACAMADAPPSPTEPPIPTDRHAAPAQQRTRTPRKLVDLRTFITAPSAHKCHTQNHLFGWILEPRPIRPRPRPTHPRPLAFRTSPCPSEGSHVHTGSTRLRFPRSGTLSECEKSVFGFRSPPPPARVSHLSARRGHFNTLWAWCFFSLTNAASLAYLWKRR